MIDHIGNSNNAERAWHILHTDGGPICFAVWYRPPHSGEVDTIHSLRDELSTFGMEIIGTLIIGDMNVY